MVVVAKVQSLQKEGFVWNRGSGEQLVVCLGLNGFTPTSKMAALKLT